MIRETISADNKNKDMLTERFQAYVRDNELFTREDKILLWCS